MDFSLTEAQTDLAALTRRILTDQVTPDRLRTVESGSRRFDPALWSALAEAGVLGAALPESVGGAGLSLLERCSVLIECGRAVAPAPYLSSIAQSAAAIARYGSGEQAERWAAPAARGTVLTAALVEELAADPATPSTHAHADGGRWRITGVKTNVPDGLLAEWFLVPADTPDGVRVFVVAAADAGVSVRRQDVVDADQTALLTLDDVAVEADRVLGDAGDGPNVVAFLRDHGTVGRCALQLGVTERALELTAAYAREREQFDRPIGSFQSVAHRLADGYLDVEAIRLTLWQAAWRLAEGLAATAEIATAKFWAADGGHRLAHTAVHIHGGVGIDLDHPLHRYFVAAKRHEFELGGATAQLRRLGATLAG